MNTRTPVGRLLVGVAVIGLLGGCGPAATPTQTPAPPSPTPGATATVVETHNVAYESSNDVFVPGELDEYSPVRAGPWPVVVMLHGGPTDNQRLDRYFLAEHARRVADLGFVVFNTSWGTGMPAGAPTSDLILATGSQAACAVEFARKNAAQYGGDPARLIIFGHSAGASTASIVAFHRPQPASGCLGAATLGEIDALVTWDGEWLAQTTFFGWDERIAADPRVVDALTPWAYVPKHNDLRVVMLSEAKPNADFNYERPLPDEAAMDAFFGPRDPSGALRAQLEANGALADGVLDLFEAQQLLYSILKAQGNPVTLDVMPDTNHTTIGDAGWPVFLAAFQKAAAKS
jgi:dienelactone hydrolase